MTLNNNSSTLKDKYKLIKSSLVTFQCDFEIINDELNILLDNNNLTKTTLFIKDNPATNFDVLIDICAIDFPEKEKRFQVVYNFLSTTQNLRVRLITNINEADFLPSITNIYPCANWYEREIYDLFGVIFTEHPDLRRILTDYDFEGHPLRKDFPLSGFVQVRYDDEQNKVITEPVKLDQEYRSFDNLSPWEGMKENLTGKLNEQ